MTTQPNHYYELYFKLVYTCQTKNYLVNPDISIKNFIEDIRVRARRDFNFNDNDEIEIVEAGQPNNINGRDAEMAPALELLDNITVRQKYQNRRHQIAFYVRRKENNT
jgi:hypothetical protein